MELTRGERFKDARIVHNQHGKQTMDEVAAATGISKSLIQALENDDKERSVGYDKVAALAAHYRVTADYLLGLTNDPHPQHTAIDDLGITTAVADRFIKFKRLAYTDCDIQAKINRVLENDDIWRLLLLLDEYAVAAKVDQICEDMIANLPEEHDMEVISEELLKMAENFHATDVNMYDFLRAKAQSFALDGPLANLGMNSFSLAELLFARINHHLSETLFGLRGGVNDGID